MMNYAFLVDRVEDNATFHFNTKVERPHTGELITHNFTVYLSQPEALAGWFSGLPRDSYQFDLLKRGYEVFRSSYWLVVKFHDLTDATMFKMRWSDDYIIRNYHDDDQHPRDAGNEGGRGDD